MSTVAVERKKLYQQVWSVPGQKLALLYGISDVGLAKVCKRYNIPRPPRGYWARLAVGQRVRKPPLPKAKPGDELVYLKGWHMPDDAIQKVMNDSSSPSQEPASSNVGAGTLHPLAVTTRESLLAAKPDHENLLTVGAPAMSARVSSALIERCVSVLDNLIKRWEARGGSIGPHENAIDQTKETSFRIGPDSLGVRLEEKVDESKPLPDPTRLTGYLAIYITGEDRREFKRRWWDTKTQRLERMLAPLVETLTNTLSVMRQERLDGEWVARQRKQVETIRKATNRDASREFYSRQELTQNVDRWHDAQRIRQYLDALKCAIDAGRVRPENAEQFAAWIDWATRFADSIDPITSGPLPEGKPPSRQNVSIADLDLTSATKSIVARLNVPNTDALWKQTQDVVRAACHGRFGPVWNEITRVLEALHYDVSQREQVSEWW